MNPPKQHANLKFFEYEISKKKIKDKSRDVSEVAYILPQMGNVIHDIRGIAIQKFIYFSRQTVNALLVNCLFS